jgi:hypothetical protein
MVRSLYLYSKYFLYTIFSSGILNLLKEFWRFFVSGDPYYKNKAITDKMRKLSLGRSVFWLLHAQDSTPDDGMGSYHMVNKWSSSYPETSGYIIPSLLQYAAANHDDNIKDAALKAANWLISIQKPSGGWQGGRVNENKPEIVFNTAQIIRGLLAAYKLPGEDKYLESAIEAGNWLCKVQDEHGTWTKNALMGKERVYDSYVDYPLLMLHQQTGVEKYKSHAVKNLEWIINEKQQDNAWFEDCDNTIKHNDRPILHTIAYTIDGLLDCGIYLNERRYTEGARKAADVLKEKFDRDGYLHGRYDRQWQGSEYMILTGCAQMSIVWLKIAHYSGNKSYAETARNMNTLLLHLQNRWYGMNNKNILGALSGSYPFWGKYEPFAFPNWATKYLADALMLEEEHFKYKESEQPK